MKGIASYWHCYSLKADKFCNSAFEYYISWLSWTYPNINL